MLQEAHGALGRKALKVFRALASQAFGGALDLENDESDDEKGSDADQDDALVLERSISRTVSSNLHEQIVGLMYAEGNEGISELQTTPNPNPKFPNPDPNWKVSRNSKGSYLN